MAILLFIIILIVVGCSKVNTDVAVSKIDKEVEQRQQVQRAWRDKVFDQFVRTETERYILDENNADEVYALQEELSKVAPELKQHPLMFYDYQFGKGFAKSDRNEVIGLNLQFFTPFMLAKKGLIYDILGLTFHHDFELNKGASWEIRRTKQTPWGLSEKSIIELNKWLERTLVANGVKDARIVFVPSIQNPNSSVFAGEFYWEKMCRRPKSAKHLW